MGMRLAAVLSLLLAGRPVQAQTTIRGTVVAGIGETPIGGALVTARRSGATATTDGLGRFAVAVTVPDTLAVIAIGWEPASYPVQAAGRDPIRVRLDPAPVVVSDLIVTAAPVTTLDLSDQTRWQMPIEAARTVPPAVETDIYRALALIPAVSFTSPLSARPMIRGYDAQEVATRIDGFEILNLYHLGRIFSSYPADATQDLAVRPAPYTSADGGSVVGIIDVTGRSGPADGALGGGGISFGSLSGYAGGGNQQARYFAAARFFHAKAIELVPGASVPFHFEDLYATLALGPAADPAGRISLFATQDKAGDNFATLSWSNLLLGGRWRLGRSQGRTVDGWASVARFHQRGDNVESLHGETADFRNGFTRAQAGLEVTWVGARWRAAFGAVAGGREVTNRIGTGNLASVTVAFPSTDTRFAGAAMAAYAEGTRRLGAVSIEAGLRVDRAGAVTSLQPRLHVRWALSPTIAVSAAAGRTSRLYHLVSDARSEPDFEFLDFWLAPNDTIPTAVVDHLTLDLSADLAPIRVRASLYASRGRGLGEVRPESDQARRRFEHLRFGRSRTWGAEVQIALRGDERRRHSLSLSYAFSRSDRDWGAGWVRWAQDRRHMLRAFGQTRLGRVRLFGSAEAATGMPLTALTREFDRHLPGSDGLPDQPFRYAPTGAIYGPENGVSTSGTLRVDAGLTFGFGGPDQNRFQLGISVVNLLYGAIAPISDRGQGRQAVDQYNRATPYRRLVDLPPIPTLTLRIEL